MSVRPFEETWLAEHRSDCRWHIQPADDKFTNIATVESIEFTTDEEREWERAQKDRASLMAAAPEMARALLKLFNECSSLDKHERRTITDALIKAGVPVEEKC